MAGAQPRSVGSQGIPPPPPLPPRPTDQGSSLYATQNKNFATEYAQFVRVHNMNKANARPMPITAQNKLRISISIGNGHSATPIGLILFYDTGAALNTGLELYHRKIMKSHPHMVAKLEIFDGNNRFNPIKLCGAITSPDDYDADKHCILSAVIE